MNFDIDKLTDSASHVHRVVMGHNPAKEGQEPEPAGFEVVGPASQQFQAAERAVAVQNVLAAEKRKVALDLSRPEDAAKMMDAMEVNRELVLEHCVVGWFGFYRGTESVPFSKEDLKNVLRARPDWAKRLVNEIEDRVNFDGA